MAKKKRRQNKHDGFIECGVLSNKLSEPEKEFYARLRARKIYNDSTGEDLPIEAFKAEKDEAGDYIITINKGGATNEN